jgi:hypothetical protein
MEDMSDNPPPAVQKLKNESKPCSQSTIIIEKPTLDIAYDLLNQNFRATDKQIMKELQTVSANYAKLVKQKNSKPSDKEALKMKILKVKTKIENLYNSEQSCLDSMTKKVDCIASDDNESRFNRLLLDHLATHGYFKTAEEILKKAEVGSSFYNSALYQEVLFAQKIDKDLSEECLESAQEWCVSNRTRLKKLSPPSDLEYRISIYEMLKISRDVGNVEAIKFAKTRLAMPGLKSETKNDRNSEKSPNEKSLQETVHQEQCHELLKTAMGFIALQNIKTPGTKQKCESKFSYRVLREIFQNEFARLYKVQKISCCEMGVQNGSQITPFQRICMTGLAALKTQQCKDDDHTLMFNSTQTGHLIGEQNCPVCSPVFSSLKNQVPNANIIGSRLLDPITGEPISDNPVVLPSSYHIYSQSTVNSLLFDGKDDTIFCPITRVKIPKNGPERVYIMS